ncbi:MAG: hypothetical protein LHV68_06970 [Elusimicrobia bacterium]|nr:hypothetical protein [Candidatus Liberimonas magnetica]
MQRNGQNPIRSTKTYEHDGNKFNSSANMQMKNMEHYPVCPKCNIPVPPKPGFRISALKCPKCNRPLGKK